MLSLKKSNIKHLHATPFKSPMRSKPAVPAKAQPIPKQPCPKEKEPQISVARSPKNLLTVLREQHGALPSSLPSSPLGRKLCKITIGMAPRVRFKDQDWGLKEAKAEFIAQGAEEAWVSNHYTQIVWKLACLVRSYAACQSRWSAAQVRSELSYRLRKEKISRHSSVIKAIIEQELKPCFYFIAVVSRAAPDAFFITDGWYEIKCAIDAPLQRALAAGRIFVGQKLGICGAEVSTPRHKHLRDSSNLPAQCQCWRGCTRLASRFPATGCGVPVGMPGWGLDPPRSSQCRFRTSMLTGGASRLSKLPWCVGTPSSF